MNLPPPVQEEVFVRKQTRAETRRALADYGDSDGALRRYVERRIGMSAAELTADEQRILRIIAHCGNAGLVEPGPYRDRLIRPQGLVPYVDQFSQNTGIIPNDLVRLHGRCVSRIEVLRYLEEVADRATPPRMHDGTSLTLADTDTLNISAFEYPFFQETLRLAQRAQHPQLADDDEDDVEIINPPPRRRRRLEPEERAPARELNWVERESILVRLAPRELTASYFNTLLLRYRSVIDFSRTPLLTHLAFHYYPTRSEATFGHLPQRNDEQQQEFYAKIIRLLYTQRPYTPQQLYVLGVRDIQAVGLMVVHGDVHALRLMTRWREVTRMQQRVGGLFATGPGDPERDDSPGRRADFTDSVSRTVLHYSWNLFRLIMGDEDQRVEDVQAQIEALMRTTLGSFAFGYDVSGPPFFLSSYAPPPPAAPQQQQQ